MNGINPIYIQGYASSITGIINSILVPVLISIAFLVFLYGVYKYFIKGADNDTERATGRTFTLYGIIGFVILFSVWGIVNIFMGTLSIGAGNMPAIPTIGGPGANPSGRPQVFTNPGSFLYGAEGSPDTSGGTPACTVADQDDCENGGGTYNMSSCTCTPAASNSGTSAGYGEGTPTCTPPQIQSPEGGCYTP